MRCLGFVHGDQKRAQGFYLISAVGAVAHHGRQLHIVSHQVHIRMTELRVYSEYNPGYVYNAGMH